MKTKQMALEDTVEEDNKKFKFDLSSRVRFIYYTLCNVIFVYSFILSYF